MKGDECKVIGIYFKTGFQSDMLNVRKADYRTFDRGDILSLLDDCKSSNAIINDYREYWANFDEIARSYKSSPLDKWLDWQAVNGFYDEMQSVLEDEGAWAGYGYVSNRSGGFWGLWYGMDEDVVEDDGFKAAIYLQVETKWDDAGARYEMKICSKLENRSTENDNKAIYRLRETIVKVQEKYDFSRPDRMRLGTYMTVGEFAGVDKSMTYEELKAVIMKSFHEYKRMLEKIKVEYKRG